MNGSLSIPEGLRHQFNKLEKRLLRFDTIVAVCGCAGSLLLSYALIFISDRLWDTPSWIRVIFTGGGIAAAGWFVHGYGRRWIWGSRSFPALATLVQKRYRRLGDRLLGIVELADESKRPANFSAALCTAAINQVAAEAAKIDFQQAVGTKRPRRYMLGLAAAVAVAALFWIVAPQAGWNALLRWAWPTFNVARYTFVNFDHLPDHLVVPHGEPFQLAVELNANSLLHPSQVTASFEKQTPVTAPVKSGIAALQLPGQTETGILTLSAGDMKRTIRIEPAFRPELKQLTAHIELPAYLLLPPFDQKIDGGSLTFLEGSRITFRGQITRPLSTAALETKGKPSTPLQVDRDTFSTAPAVPQAATLMTFTWKDSLGLDNAAPAKVRLQPKEDAAPHVECRGLAAAIAILEDEVVHIDIVADDDYGILDVGARWQTAPQKTDQVPGPLETRKIITGSPHDRTLKAKFDFSPVLLHIAPDTSVAFCATVTDRFPNRPASLSEVHQIYVLSKEAHARLIQEKLEKLMAQLEELTRRQEALRDAGKNVRDQSPEKLKDQDSEKKLDDQASEQKETAAQLEKLAQQTADTVREASRNSDISPSSLSDLAKHAEAMNELAQQNMPAASQSLADSKNDPADRSSKLDQALTQEDEILKQMRDMQKATENSLEKLMTENIAARLRKIAATEKSIVAGFQKILPDTIGMKADQLPDAPKQSIAHMADSHEAARGESGKLQNEITRLFERTQTAKYGDVSQEMDTMKTDDALAKLTETIQQNVTVQAIQSAGDWSKQFEQWATKLSDSDDSKAGDPSQGGKGQPGDMKTMMALMKIRQQEDALREQTSAIDQQKKSDSNYDQETKDAATRQQEIGQSLDEVANDPESQLPPEELAPIQKAMKDAGMLLSKPDTGNPTTAAETDAINMLDAAILAAGKKSGKSMASLMQMMGFGPGKSSGGNTSGGDTDRMNTPIPGTRVGAAAEGRHTTQTTGNGSAPLPSEFREAIEGYQHAIEQEGATP